MKRIALIQIMTPEERFERIERQLEFLAAHQAEFHERDRRLQEEDQRLQEEDRRLQEEGRQLQETGRQLQETVQQHSEQIGQLTTALSKTVQVVDRLAEAQRRTDERLSAIINVVERYLSNGRH